MFPSRDAFDQQMEKVEAYTKAIAWSQLAINEIYKIEDKRIILKTKFGKGMILRVSNVDGNTYHVWSPNLLSQKLLEEGEDKKKVVKFPCFIRPLGLKQCKNDTSRSYQAFQLLSAAELNITE
jgi:hypothetical protein